MRPDPRAAEVAKAEGESTASIPLGNLFTGFLLIGLMGFGGIAASGYYVIVDRRRWLTAEDYLDLLGICTILPGGNVLNASVMIGDRYHGPVGALVCLFALLLMPLVILIALAVAYDAYAYLPYVRAASAGAASAAAGLIVGTAARLARGVAPTPPAFLFGIATFAAIGVFHLPMWVIILVIVPASVAGLRWWGGRA